MLFLREYNIKAVFNEQGQVSLVILLNQMMIKTHNKYGITENIVESVPFVHCSLCWCTAVSVGALQSLLVYCSHCWCTAVTVGALQSLLVYCSLCWCTAVSVGALQSLLVHCSHCWCTAVTVGTRIYHFNHISPLNSSSQC